MFSRSARGHKDRANIRRRNAIRAPANKGRSIDPQPGIRPMVRGDRKARSRHRQE